MNAPAQMELGLLGENLALRDFPGGRVDPEAIARREGIALTYASLPVEVEGLATGVPGNFAIWMNERHARRGSPRSRFTLAHELGHCFQPSDGVAARIRGDGSPPSPAERRSDRFAAHLLMPEPTFRDLATRFTTFDLRCVTLVAAQLGVSVTATAYRAMELDLFPAPAAVLRWNLLGERCGRRLSPRTRLRGRGYACLAETPPVGTITAQVVADFAIGLHRSTAHVMDWFTELDGYGPLHQIQLREEVMSLGQYGWLTIIHS